MSPQRQSGSRRIPHPDSLVSGGPEIDVGIQTDSVLVLGEAKWRSSVGKAQGVARDKDQIQLRAEFCAKYGRIIYPSVDTFVILGIAQTTGLLTPEQLRHDAGLISVKEVTWEQLGALKANPWGSEFCTHLAWRHRHSKAV